MAIDQAPKTPSIGEMLQAIPRFYLYLLLFLTAGVPLFFDIHIPNKPADATVDLYTSLMALPTDKPVLLSSDWTNSTRAESRGEFEAVLRILMKRNIKFVVFSIADPQAPPVADNVIRDLNAEREANHLAPYKRWSDWVEVGYYANAEGTVEGLAVSIAKTFASKQDINLEGEKEDVFNSPVLKGVSTLKDVGALIEITGSATDQVYIQRLAAKVEFLELCTGVMGPQAIPYYSSGQVKGLSPGLKGVFDLETLMVTGVNVKGEDGQVASTSSRSSDPVPGFMDPKFQGKGYAYYPALHFTMALLILAIIVGNVGMFLAKKEKRS